MENTLTDRETIESWNEEELRFAVREFLYKNKGGCERIMDVHGKHEYGVDIVITKKDAFGKLRAFGIQVKQGDITCSKGKVTYDVKTIIGQLAIAFGDEVPIDDPKYTWRYEGLYVITNGQIDIQAMKYIKCANVCVRNINFLSIDDLCDIFGQNFITEIKAEMATFKEV